MDQAHGSGEIGGMNESPICIKLTLDEKDELERLARSLTAPYRAVVRAKTILLLADDFTVSEVARLVGRQRRIVRKWAWRFIKKRLQGLVDDPRSGRPARFSPLGGSSPGQIGMRVARRAEAIPIAVDVRRTGTNPLSGWKGRQDLAAVGARDLDGTQTQAVANPLLAQPQDPS